MAQLRAVPGPGRRSRSRSRSSGSTHSWAISTSKSAVHIQTSIPGRNRRELFRQEQKFIAPGTQGFAPSPAWSMDHGEGATLTDVRRNRYIDFIAGITSRPWGIPPEVGGDADQPDPPAFRWEFSLPKTGQVSELSRIRPPATSTGWQFYSGGRRGGWRRPSPGPGGDEEDRGDRFWADPRQDPAACRALGSSFKHSSGRSCPALYHPYPDGYRCPFKDDLSLCEFTASISRGDDQARDHEPVARILVRADPGDARQRAPPRDDEEDCGDGPGARRASDRD